MSGLAVSNLSYSYGAKQALGDVSFEVARGDFCALLGPNGAGKTTLFALLTRLFLPRAGHIEIAGMDLAKEPRKALGRMGVIFQQPTLDLDLTVRRNLSYYAALHGISGRDAARRIDAALDRLDMRERAWEKARNLNGGHRRRMEIARALIHRPAVLLLDEPTVGLDVATRMSITAYVHKLCRDEGITALWATHLVDEIMPEDALIVLHRGDIVAKGRVSDVVAEKTLGERFAALTGSGAETAQ
ncbi:MAG: ATP-binding cassette domain-containing protein [Hyphomicrobiales bacterium]|nr:ATP-binding cassette domain-containing protein [Hyphomicrobiales bacterium]